MKIHHKDRVHGLTSFKEYTLSYSHPSELSINIFLQCYFSRTLIRPLLDKKQQTCQNVMRVTQSSIDPTQKQEPDRATED